MSRLHDSFECTKYFGPIVNPSIALAVLDEARAEGTSGPVSVACTDGVSKCTGCCGRPLAVVSSTGAGACIQEV